METINVIYPFRETFNDYPDNESLAVIVYLMGCSNECPGCQNPEFQNKGHESGTRQFNLHEFAETVQAFMKRCNTKKLVLSGGDPMYEGNIAFVKRFLETVGDKIDVCIYTGHTIDYVKANGVKGFRYIKCGKYSADAFQKGGKTDDAMVLATTNQNFYDQNYELVSWEGRLSFLKKE